MDARITTGKPAAICYNIPMSNPANRPRVLTGDTPTGRLHLGHYVGSIESRLVMQETHDCFFIIANTHALTTRSDKTAEVRDDILEITKDYLAAGIDPQRSTIFLQSEVPAIAELSWFFAMLVSFNRVMKNPTLKTEIELKGLGDSYSFGFPMYAVGQMADILAFRPHWVPVGEDQVPHIEMTREVARKFNYLYCGVDPHADDSVHEVEGVFPIPGAKVGRIARLTGTDGKAKMSKSLGNAILLSDSPKDVKKKVSSIPTSSRSPTEPGVVEGNVLFEWMDAFNHDAAEVAELKDRYRRGDNLGDGHIKVRLTELINALLEPMRQRRAALDADPGKALAVLRDGTARANAAAEETLWAAKKAMKWDFFGRRLSLQ